MLRATLLLIACVSVAGCLRSTQFQCENDAACGANGRCEANKFCSFPDPGCASGRVYSDSAGTNAGKCTDENMPQVDAAVDSPTLIDARGDGSSNCPQDFTALPAGNGHVYKVITTTADWAAQQSACRALSNNQAYLTVPDSQAELTATDGLPGVGASYWVGLSDNGSEGTWHSVYDNSVIPDASIPWDTQNNQPDNAMGGQNCADSDTSTHKLSDDRCTNTLRAVCECNP